jgi:hypothetical protein
MSLLPQALSLIWLLAFLLPRRMLWLSVALGLIALVPFHGMSLAMILRGFWGDPGVTTMSLLILGIAGRPPAALARDWRAPAVIAGFSLLFYPLALGASGFDPWQLGFQPILPLILLGVPALLMLWRGQALWCWLLSINLIAFSAGLLDSTNFWDYVIDPFLAIACVVLAIRNLLRGRNDPAQGIRAGPGENESGAEGQN